MANPVKYAFSQEDCKPLIFQDYQKYKNYYNVLDSWREVERAILDTYEPPAVKASAGRPDATLWQPLLDGIDPGFYRQTKEAVRNSVFYMFMKYRDFMYVRIRKNQLVLFGYVANAKYVNPLHEHFHNPKARAWVDMGSVVRVFRQEWTEYQVGLSYYETRLFVEELVKLGVPDCDFIVNHKERLVLKRDLTEASEELVGSKRFPLQAKFKKAVYLPMLSFNWGLRYADYPLPSPDDLGRIFGLFSPLNCTNQYADDAPVAWAGKKATAVFRGSFTGNGATVETNPRLKLASLSKAWATEPSKQRLLDAGITSFQGIGRPRKRIDSASLEYADKALTRTLSASFMGQPEQKNYKYVLYVEGNVAAYRAAYLFSYNSVVIWVRSRKYHLWFEPFLKDRVNCVMVDPDLTELEDTIRWLQQHDDKAEAIAAQGRMLYDRMLSKAAVLQYGRVLLHKVAGVDLEASRETVRGGAAGAAAKTAVIVVPYADLRPEQQRAKQLDAFIKHFEANADAMLAKVHVVIAEQVQPTELFNRGQLLNLGLHWFVESHGSAPDLVITHDVDMLPNRALLREYVGEYSIKQLVPQSKTFADQYAGSLSIGGGIAGFTYDAFRKFNGYPNTFWGWGGEDDAVSDRIKRCKLRWSAVQVGDYKSTDVQRASHRSKMDYLKANFLRNMQAWEAREADRKQWRHDGFKQVAKLGAKVAQVERLVDHDSLVVSRVQFELAVARAGAPLPVLTAPQEIAAAMRTLNVDHPGSHIELELRVKPKQWDALFRRLQSDAKITPRNSIAFVRNLGGMSKLSWEHFEDGESTLTKKTKVFFVPRGSIAIEEPAATPPATFDLIRRKRRFSFASACNLWRWDVTLVDQEVASPQSKAFNPSTVFTAPLFRMPIGPVRHSQEHLKWEVELEFVGQPHQVVRAFANAQAELQKFALD